MNNWIHAHLVDLLRLAAFGQLVVAILGPLIPRILDWRKAIDEMPLLVREVFHIHTFFIAFTCLFFSVITWRFAADFALPGSELVRWFAGGVGLFWGIRCVFQWTLYSASHWRGQFGRTVAHWTLFVGYAVISITYFSAALRP